MKIAKCKAFHVKPVKLPLFIQDEAGCFSANSDYSAIMAKARSSKTIRIVSSQAIMKFNSGKRVRFLSSFRREDTGESIKPLPKKFIPLQVSRKMREVMLNELANEAQKLGMYN